MPSNGAGHGPDPVWIEKAVVLAVQDEQLAEHGGASGLRDEGALESALMGPENLGAHGGIEDLHRLAATYAFGIARNHAFIDGNKRTSLVVAETFLALNGIELDFSDEEGVAIWLQLANGELTHEELAAWLHDRTKRL